MAQSTDEALICAAHERLCAALSTCNAASLVALFCLDEVNVWGPEPDDRAHSPAELLELAKAIGGRPPGYSFAWRERTVLAADDVAWFTAVGSISRAGPTLLERRPCRMTGVLLLIRREWRWRLLDMREGPWDEPDGARPRP